MGWIIALIILLFLVLIGLIYIKLSFVFDENGAELSVKVLFFKFLLYGEKEENIKEHKFRIKSFRRSRDRRMKRSEKKLLKKQKNKKEKNVPAEQKQAETDNQPKTEKPTEKPKKKFSVKTLASDITDIYGEIIKRFPGYLRIDCARLIVSVGGKEAADIAINYGVTVQSVQYFVTLLKRVTHFKAGRKAEISVYPDFASGEWKAEADIVMKLRLHHILALGVRFLIAYLTADKKRAKRKKTA